MTILASDVQRSYPGQLVTLFQLDCTNLANGTILYFTPTTSSAGEAILFNGITYTPVDIEATGFEWTGSSAFPTPTLRLSNVDRLASALVIAYEDLIGATLTRIRTFSQYLDDGDTPDPLQIFPPDVYQVEQKTMHTRKQIEWKLSAAVDQQGMKIPSFPLVRDYCNHVYRKYDAVNDVMKYERATCPYSGDYYDSSNIVTDDPRADMCPKTLGGCRARFGENTPLPFKGLPGLGRFK